MIFTLKDLEPKDMPNLKGGEGVIAHRKVDDGMTSIIMNVMPAGSSVGFHQHVGTCEVIYVLEGDGRILEDGKYTPIKKGDVNYCPEGGEHSILAGENGMTIFAVIPKQTRA